jgi:hypothetical protein
MSETDSIMRTEFEFLRLSNEQWAGPFTCIPTRILSNILVFVAFLTERSSMHETKDMSDSFCMHYYDRVFIDICISTHVYNLESSDSQEVCSVRDSLFPYSNLLQVLAGKRTRTVGHII